MPPVRREFPCPRRTRRDGFTVVEASVAGAIIILFLTSLFALNSTVMRLLGSSAETSSASQELQQRVEQVRLANWNQITDPTWVQTYLLGTPTDASVNLPGITETLTVTTYVSPASSAASYAAASTGASFTIKRSSTGAFTVTSSSSPPASSLPNQEMVQVDLAVSWPGWNRQRETSVVSARLRWGISK